MFFSGLECIKISDLAIFFSNEFSHKKKAAKQYIEIDKKNVICKEKTTFKKFLKENQYEKLIWFGIANDGSTLTELYESAKTKTWTILETDTNGISCATIGGNASTFLKH